MRNHAWGWIAITLVAASCSKESAGPAPKTNEGSAAASAVAKPTEPLTAAVLGAKPAVPAALGISIGGDATKTNLPVKGYAASPLTGIKYNVDADARGVITGVMLDVSPETKDIFTQAWGAGITIQDVFDQPQTLWFDPDASVRATYQLSAQNDSPTVAIEHYVPAKKLLGEGAEFTLLGVAVIGAPAANIPPQLLGSFEMEWGDTMVIAGGDPITSISVSIPWTRAPSGKADLDALFTAKWGKPSSTIHNERVFNASNARVSIKDSNNKFELYVSPKK